MLNAATLRFSLLALLCLACQGTPQATDAEAGPLQARSARLQADVAWLADDARAGRRAGEPGAMEAADWLARQCAEIGLEPAGANGWFQDFTVDLEAKDGGGSRLIISAGDKVSELAGAQTLQPLFCGEAGSVTGELVWLGYGIEDPDQGWDDYAGRDLTGKIALVVRLQSGRRRLWWQGQRSRRSQQR